MVDPRGGAGCRAGGGGERVERHNPLIDSATGGVSASPAFQAKIEAVIRDVLTRKRETGIIANDALEMRRAIAEERGESDIWDLKTAAGGMVDIEFIAQTLQLIHAGKKDVLRASTSEALAALALPEAAGFGGSLQQWCNTQRGVRECARGSTRRDPCGRRWRGRGRAAAARRREGARQGCGRRPVTVARPRPVAVEHALFVEGGRRGLGPLVVGRQRPLLGRRRKAHSVPTAEPSDHAVLCVACRVVQHTISRSQNDSGLGGHTHALSL